MELRTVSDSDIAALSEVVRIVGMPDTGTTFTAIANGLEIASKYIWVVQAVAAYKIADVIPDGGGVFRRFYNETANLIACDTKRTIRVESWAGIIGDMVAQAQPDNADVVNIGTTMVLRTNSGSAGMNARQLGHDDLNKSLLSYAPYEIMERWIYSRDGINDMLQSILMLLTVYKTFYTQK